MGGGEGIYRENANSCQVGPAPTIRHAETTTLKETATPILRGKGGIHGVNKMVEQEVHVVADNFC